MNLWLITVNYGNIEMTKGLINSLMCCHNINSIRVGIADNASSDKSIAELEKIMDNAIIDIEIFSFKQNHFYWPAAKKVIFNLKEKWKNYPDWIMICNNDITFVDNEFFKKLQKLDKKNFPIIGPNIKNDSGLALNPFMVNSMRKFDHLYWSLYFLSYPTSRTIRIIKNWFQKISSSPGESRLKTNSPVYAVHGSAILFSSYFFEKGGWLDDNFEMYGEELTVAEIAKKIALPITYCPDLHLLHHEHTITKKINKKFIFNKSKDAHRYVKSNYLK